MNLTAECACRTMQVLNAYSPVCVLKRFAYVLPCCLKLVSTKYVILSRYAVLGMYMQVLSTQYVVLSRYAVLGMYNNNNFQS